MKTTYNCRLHPSSRCLKRYYKKGKQHLPVKRRPKHVYEVKVSLDREKEACTTKGRRVTDTQHRRPPTLLGRNTGLSPLSSLRVFHFKGRNKNKEKLKRGNENTVHVMFY